jgi:hypothetical protein
MFNAWWKKILLTAASVVTLAGSLQAQALWINGVGASGQWKTWGIAALYALPAPTKSFTAHNIAAVDDTARLGSIPLQKGDLWVVWSGPDSAPTDIAAYLTVDSTVGIRAMYAAPAAKLWLDPNIGTTASANLLGFTDAPALPAAVISVISGQPFTVAFSEMRPEDAKFATTRSFSLGYGVSPVGSAIKSSVVGSTKSVQAVDFNILGNDPITGAGVRTDLTTDYVGATPVVVFVNNQDTAKGGFGSTDGTGAPVFTNVTRAQLAGFADGSFSRTKDLNEDYTLPNVTTTTFLREPLSGTYNTFEFNVPASAGLQSSQEKGVIAATDNPLNKVATGGGSRRRVIGTGEMTGTGAVAGIQDSLGYAFWGYGNFSTAFATTRYLSVDGIDPIQDSYFSYGYYPATLDKSTLKNVKNGTYPIWGIYHAVLPYPASGYYSYIKAVSEYILPYLPEYVPFSTMKVFRSHYTQSGVTPHNGNVAAAAGGNVGGKVYPIQADIDYYNYTGLELVNRKE